MKSKKKHIVLLLVMLCMMLAALPAQAASSKDVTSKYKTKVSKMLGKFDNFLGYDISEGRGSKKFPFNDYTKTCMLAYANISDIIPDVSVSTAKSKLSGKMKLYFGGSKSSIKFKSISKTKYPYLFGKQNNKVYYMGGNYGESYCYGNVSRITKKGSRYIATYKIYITSYGTGWKKVKSGGTYCGTYRVTLKKASNQYGFIIKNMERTKVA